MKADRRLFPILDDLSLELHARLITSYETSFKLRVKDDINTSDILSLAHAQEELANLAARLDECKKEVNKALDLVRITLVPDLMNEQGITSIGIDGLGTMFLRPEVSVSIKDGGKAAVYQWINDAGGGDLIQPYIAPTTLKAFVKARMETGEEVHEQIKVNPFSMSVILHKS